MASVRRSLWTAVALALAAAGAVAVAAAWWTRPVARADAALARGEWDAALAEYAAAEARFDRFPALRLVFARDAARTVRAQLAIDYRQQRFDEVIARAERAPDEASPHFWAGLAYFAKSRGEGRDEGRIDEQSGWLMRAEEELRRAVEAEPDDLDVKYDFELVTRFAAALRRRPQTPPDQLAPLLRPEPRPGARTPRRVG